MPHCVSVGHTLFSFYLVVALHTTQELPLYICHVSVRITCNFGSCGVAVVMMPWRWLRRLVWTFQVLLRRTARLAACWSGAALMLSRGPREPSDPPM